jgi:Holliday junction resolvase RusA-like endonuclease
MKTEIVDLGASAPGVAAHVFQGQIIPLTEVFSFTVPGHPTGKGAVRPSFRQPGRYFTPKKTRNFMAWVRDAFCSRYPTAVPLKGPAALGIRALYQVPASMPKKVRAAMPPPVVKPDLKNIVAGVEDALNGVAWVDDKQVVLYLITKTYAWDGRPRLEISISEVTT